MPLAACTAGGLIAAWGLESVLHSRRIESKEIRIHVNGIRGKSTVTRILAGLLREAGLKTIAKTTGSAACVVDHLGTDHPIRRNGAPTILEQVGIVKKLVDDTDALVIECMAIKPEYQRICENKIIKSNIGVITNVREDHQDILGHSLEEIAGNLLSTCPQGGVLITAERNPAILKVFREVAVRRDSRLIVTDAETVTDDQLRTFPYVAFKENIAIGFAVAELLGVDKQIALRGMASADPDPGVLSIKRKTFAGRNITWADLFAVNDRESVIKCVERVSETAFAATAKVGLLNNRTDREHRAIQFAAIAARDLELDYVALLGAYEKRVEAELIRSGFPADRIVLLGEQRGISGQPLVETLLEVTGGEEVLVIGMVNIHTDQAESLRHWFADGEGVVDERD